MGQPADAGARSPTRRPARGETWASRRTRARARQRAAPCPRRDMGQPADTGALSSTRGAPPAEKHGPAGGRGRALVNARRPARGVLFGEQSRARGSPSGLAREARTGRGARRRREHPRSPCPGSSQRSSEARGAREAARVRRGTPRHGAARPRASTTARALPPPSSAAAAARAARRSSSRRRRSSSRSPPQQLAATAQLTTP